MMDELCLTGYCRALNAARTVLADGVEGTVDCSYPDCPHVSECDIARRMGEFFCAASHSVTAD